MKRIITSLLIVLSLGVAVTAATRALFSDTATLGASTFSTGTLDLRIDSDPDSNVAYWSNGFNAPAGYIDELFPGASGHQVIDIKNVGSVDGDTTLKFVRTSTANELRNNLFFTVSYDENNDNLDWVTIASGTLAQFEGNTYQLGPMSGTDNIASVKIEWSVPTTAGNDIQGDQVTIDTIFGLNQTN